MDSTVPGVHHTPHIGIGSVNQCLQTPHDDYRHAVHVCCSTHTYALAPPHIDNLQANHNSCLDTHCNNRTSLLLSIGIQNAQAVAEAGCSTAVKICWATVLLVVSPCMAVFLTPVHPFTSHAVQVCQHQGHYQDMAITFSRLDATSDCVHACCSIPCWQPALLHGG